MLAAPASERNPTVAALSLRVAELSSVLKQQREEVEENRQLLEHNRKIVKDHEEVIRMQEGQLLERDAQLQAQNAEIRALRRQHSQDAEALRVAYTQLQGKIRPSGSMGTPRMVQQQQQQQQARGRHKSPTKGGIEGELGAPHTPTKSPTKRIPSSPPGGSTRRQLQQALADKVVLVRALHQLTAEMAEARAETRKYAAASERSLSTALKLGQLGQLGLALLGQEGEEGEGFDDEADLQPLPELEDATPMTGRLLPPDLSDKFAPMDGYASD